ncbi:MAG: AAA family ATPase [Symploca sp. SIO2B6]|nr:AAA family ATPase [Symploca sp. SIO2B6]
MAENFNLFSQGCEFSLQDIQLYLSSALFRGIGVATAKKLVDHFGESTLKVLESQSERLVEVRDLPPYRIKQIKKAWWESQQQPQRFTIAKLYRLGISLKLILELCYHYGDQTEAILRQNPYRLVEEVEGIGFNRADELALLLGYSPDSLHRYSQGVIYVLKEALKQGHCFLPEKLLWGRTLELLQRHDYFPQAAQLKAAMVDLLSKSTIKEGFSEGSIYLSSVYRIELKVALKLIAFSKPPFCDESAVQQWLAATEEEREEGDDASDRLSEQQRRAIVMASQHSLSILYGGPGRGKTHVLKTLCQWLTHQNLRVALIAPTGKAANRMESVIGKKAATIHRLLQWQGRKEGFLYNEKNPIPEVDYLICDEFSMVDIFLFYSLLKAMPTGAKMLLVGDKDQLPSIGAGMVLKDLINSELLGATQLTQVYRQGFGNIIVQAADQVNRGVVPELYSINCAQEWSSSDCPLWKVPTPTEAASTLVALARQMQSDGVELHTDVMVIAPQKKGVAGVNNLNKLLQEVFNPPCPSKPELRIKKRKTATNKAVSSAQSSEETEEVVFRKGDRVMQLENDYNHGVMNGETGQVIVVDKLKQLVTVSFEGGAMVEYCLSSLEKIAHSFAITCHKSQGSEFQYVLIPLLLACRRMLTRQLLYTAMTRAKVGLIVVGQPEALKVAVETNRPAQRYTQLSTQLLLDRELLRSQLRESRSASATKAEPGTVTIASRVQQRQLNLTAGQMTSIGSFAVSLYVERYGTRPSKRPEQVGSYRFKTYHYEIEALWLVDRAIDLVLQTPETG